MSNVEYGDRAAILVCFFIFFTILFPSLSHKKNHLASTIII